MDENMSCAIIEARFDSMMSIAEDGYEVIRGALGVDEISGVQLELISLVDMIAKSGETTISGLIKQSKWDVVGVTEKELGNGLEVEFDNAVCKAKAKTGASSEVIATTIWEYMETIGWTKSFLSQGKLLQRLISLIGPDLSYCEAAQPTLLCKPGEDHGNYLRKEYHQEVWSGCSLDSLQIWTPLFQEDTKSQLEIITGSHKWGLVPNRGRKPIELPENADDRSECTELEYGDVLVFHPLLLHRSVYNPRQDLARLGMPLQVKNWRIRSNENFASRKAWKPFHYSEMTAVEMALGNKYLTPFRLEGIERDMI